MLKNLIVLPDGTEIYSGIRERNNIRNTTITKCVNNGTELTLGSVCASMLECALQTPHGGLDIDTGNEVTLYKVDDAGTRYKVGLFTLETPKRASAHSYKITAYDRITWLDKDLTDWLAGLDAWPYTVNTFAQMVCEACGLTLATTDLLNGNYEIQKFSASGITGRKLLGWIGEICACFCRANIDGEIEFAWYKTNDRVSIGPGAAASPVSYDGQGNVVLNLPDDAEVTEDADGNVTINAGSVEIVRDADGDIVITDTSVASTVPYFQGKLSYEDYQITPVQKVQVRLTEDDVGVICPQIVGERNTYIIEGNYLLTTTDPALLEPVVENIYAAIKDVRYTPCEVRIQATADIDAGDIVEVTDPNGATISIYVMTMTQSGQGETLECTGNYKRDSSTVVNNLTLGALNAKMLEVKTSIEGLSVTATSQREELETLKTDITTVKQDADGVEIRVKSIEDNGATKVTTEMGYTFSDDGLHIQRAGEEIENTLDHTGMYVERGNDVMLQANADGVVATDVTVRNYLVVGTHARFEDYIRGTDTKRTACYWI